MPSLTKNNNIALLLLAAGSSSRLGHPKQLIKLGDITLLEKMADAAIRSDCQSVVVALGAYFHKIKNSIENKNIHILENRNWESGMGSTIVCGMAFLRKKHPAIDAVILMVCDQPYLDEKILNKLIRKWQGSGKDIVACKYGNTVGVPALFSKNIFPELLKLDSEHGAKKIIQKNSQDVIVIDFEKGVFDIDSERDLDEFYLSIH